MAGRPKIPVKQRFMEKVTISEDGCWYWTAFCMKNGYGLFRFPNGHKLAHRVAYSLFNGDLDPKLDVMHSCDNPNCVNPEHLSLGTRLENMADAKKKGRMVKGEKHGRAKLNNEQALAIKNASGCQKNIAKEFNISQTLVWEIKNGRKWAHL